MPGFSGPTIVSGWDSCDAETAAQDMCIWRNSPRTRFQWRRLPYVICGTGRASAARTSKLDGIPTHMAALQRVMALRASLAAG